MHTCTRTGPTWEASYLEFQGLVLYRIMVSQGAIDFENVVEIVKGEEENSGVSKWSERASDGMTRRAAHSPQALHASLGIVGS